MSVITAAQKKSLRAAIVRRFGDSACGFTFAAMTPLTIRITDDETGSWVEGNFAGSRMGVVAEHDASAQGPVEMVAQPVQQQQAHAVADHVRDRLAQIPADWSDEPKADGMVQDAESGAWSRPLASVGASAAPEAPKALDPALIAAFRFHRQNQARGVAALSVEVNRTPGRRDVLALDCIARAREDVRKSKTRYPAEDFPGHSAWGTANSKIRYIENPAALGLRFVGRSHQMVSLNHTGYYTSDDGDKGEIVGGVVYQLPSRKGYPVYVAGHDDVNNDSPAVLDFGTLFYGEKCGVEMHGTITDSKGARDAARHGDRMAERFCDHERDHNRAWQAGSDWATARDDYSDQRKQVIAALREAREAMGAKYRPSLVRRNTLTIFARLRDQHYAFLAKLFDEYGHADAFKEHS